MITIPVTLTRVTMETDFGDRVYWRSSLLVGGAASVEFKSEAQIRAACEKEIDRARGFDLLPPATEIRLAFTVRETRIPFPKEW